ncbi:MAG: PAS domain-containing protein, partial [Methylotenera sp.]|nr:PAS domain-containing protein [Methylotenera sp.]
MMRQIYDFSAVLDEEFTCLIEAIPDAIFLKDGAGRWLITNEAAKALFQLHGFDWQGKTDKELAAERPDMQSI